MRTVIARFVLVCVGLGIIGLMSTGQSFAAIDPATCVAAWLFEGDAVDSSGNGNNGTVEGGPGWVSGQFGQAMDLDGADDQVVVPDSASLELANLTMTAWIYLRSYPEDARIISQEVDGAPYSAYSIMMSGGGYKKFEFRIALDNDRKRIPSSVDIPLNQWTHVAATYDGANAVLYINGEIDQTVPQTGALLTTDNPVQIGGSQYWVPRLFAGLMDDAALFNVALTQDDVKSLMNNGLAAEIAGSSAVSSEGKLAATWAQIKSR